MSLENISRAFKRNAGNLAGIALIGTVAGTIVTGAGWLIKRDLANDARIEAQKKTARADVQDELIKAFHENENRHTVTLNEYPHHDSQHLAVPTLFGFTVEKDENNCVFVKAHRATALDANGNIISMSPDVAVNAEGTTLWGRVCAPQ